jgi:hypothetical protein
MSQICFLPDDVAQELDAEGRPRWRRGLLWMAAADKIKADESQ